MRVTKVLCHIWPEHERLAVWPGEAVAGRRYTATDGCQHGLGSNGMEHEHLISYTVPSALDARPTTDYETKDF